MNEYNQFLEAHEVPPKHVLIETQKDITLSFHKKSILSRFLFFQILGAAFSLIFCPQFGLGLAKGHGLVHTFRMIGDWACASYCGSLFLSSGVLLAFIGMKGEELWWIWRRYKVSLIFIPTLFWAALMGINLTFDLTEEVLSFHIFWILTAIFAQALWLKLRSYLYINKLQPT